MSLKRVHMTLYSIPGNDSLILSDEEKLMTDFMGWAKQPPHQLRVKMLLPLICELRLSRNMYSRSITQFLPPSIMLYRRNTEWIRVLALKNPHI